MDQKRGEKKLKLALQHSFGSSTSRGYLNSLGMFQEDGSQHLIYPVGKYIGIKSTERQDMSFIKLSPHLEQIDCMAISNNKKYIAVGEKLFDSHLKKNKKQQPLLSIYTLNFVTSMKFQNAEKKQMSYPDCEGDKFLQMRFTEDSRFLIMQTSDYKLVFLENQSKMREIASGYEIRQAASRITACPVESHCVVVTGVNLFQIFHIKESRFQPKQESVKKLGYQQNFVDHCWMDENKIAVANDKQDIFIIDYLQNEVKQELKDIFQNNHRPGIEISCIQSFTKGIIVSSNNATFSIWIKNEDSNNIMQRQDDDYPLVYLRRFESERDTSICAMDIGNNNDVLAVAFSNNDLATFDLTKVLPQLQEPIDQYKNNKTQLNQKVYFNYVYDGFHNGSIVSMDVCIQRPLIVTVSKQDSTLRIWNYRNYKCELARRFQVDKQASAELCPLICASFHPSGYILAAGFVDKLRVFHILNKELRPYKELVIKGASIIKFSNGGQYMAVSHPKPKSSQYYTTIYNGLTFETITTLKSHSQQVTDIVWDPRDESLATCAKDGIIFEYRNYLSGAEKIDIQHDSIKCISSMIYNDTNKSWMVSGVGNSETSNVVGEYQRSLSLADNSDIKTLIYKTQKGDSTYCINSFVYVRGYHSYTGIIGGLKDGTMCTYGHNFNPYQNDQIQAHNGDINKVCVSPDGLYCFSAGKDGCIFIYQIQEVNEEGHTLDIKGSEKDEIDLNPRANVVDPGLADVVLVNKEEIDKYLNEQKKLANDYEDLGNKMEYQTQEEKKRMDERIQEMENKKKEEIKQWTSRYEELKNQKTKIEKESAVLLKGMENNHLKAVEELEILYEKKLAFENEKYLQQEQELLEERMNFDRKLKQIENSHDYNIQDLKGEFSNNFQKAQSVFEKTKSQAQELNKHYEEKLDQQEEEHEMEIRELNEKHANKIAELKDRIADLQSKNDMYIREEKTIEENMQKMKKKMEEREEKCKALEQRLSDSSNQIEVLKSEIKNLEEQLQKKEKKIHEYKYKINDLQKSKHVLSFRATEMRKSLEPKEAQIDKLKDELFKLEGEFEAMLKNSETLKKDQEYKTTQINSLNKSLKIQTGLTNQKESLLNKIIMQIHDCVKEMDNKYWIQEMQKLYDQYVINTTLKSSPHDAKGVEEMSRHIQHLEKSIKQMNISSEKIILRREQEVHKKLKENAELIYDLNELRKLNKDYINELQHKKMECDNLTKDKEDLLKQLKNQNKFTKNQSIQDNNQQSVLSRTQNRFQENKANMQRPQSMKMPSRQQGKIVRGANYDSKTLGTFEKAKIMDMLAQLEISSHKLISQEVVIKDIRSKIKKHIHERNCNDQLLEEEVMILNQQEMGLGQQQFSQEFQNIDTQNFGLEQN